jgi:hypothetical protein
LITDAVQEMFAQPSTTAVIVVLPVVLPPVTSPVESTAAMLELPEDHEKDFPGANMPLAR